MSAVVRFSVCAALFATVVTGAAQPWDFSPAIDVARTGGDGVFHHLESSGRRNIAVSGATVAIAWEDDHDGTPRVYLARKNVDATAFNAALRISGEGEAYEPSLAALENDRFVVVWEEDGQVLSRIVAGKRIGKSINVSRSEAAQANVSVRGSSVYVLRSQREGRFSRVRLHVLRVDKALELVSESDCAVDPAPMEDDQFYPASAVTDNELIAAWEDRRPGHTIIMTSTAKLVDVCAFGPPVRISEPRARTMSQYGKGHGVARVALGGTVASGLTAVWADKRNYWEGYDIYAARYLGEGRFGPNTKVQDEFGDFARQWHAAVAAGADGRLVVAWDDEREANSDVMLSWSDKGTWSEDLPLPGASDSGQQTHPSIALDAEGNLHAAWIERTQKNGPTRLRYQFGRATAE